VKHIVPGDPMTENRSIASVDLSDPQVRIDLWKTLKNNRFAD
jgi:hypothetical protein